jgi:tol-pal system protein YbgF
MEDYNRLLTEKDQDLRSQSAGLNVMLDNLREDIRVLTGRLEEHEYLLQQKIKAMEAEEGQRKIQLNRLEEISRLNKNRVIRIEQYLNLESSASAPEGFKGKQGAETQSTAAVNAQLPENEMYRLAKQAFDQGELNAAREGFTNFIKRFPKSANADNAQFWVGETYFREKWYEKAILEYQVVIEKYPRGNKVQASLLKQGLAFFNIGDKTNSRLRLKELVQKYPQSNEARIARQKLKAF